MGITVTRTAVSLSRIRVSGEQLDYICGGPLQGRLVVQCAGSVLALKPFPPCCSIRVVYRTRLLAALGAVVGAVLLPSLPRACPKLAFAAGDRRWDYCTSAAGEVRSGPAWLQPNGLSRLLWITSC